LICLQCFIINTDSKQLNDPSYTIFAISCGTSGQYLTMIQIVAESCSSTEI
jgi:hypothetical protein